MQIITTSEITVRLIQSMGGDHMVVAAAKVSTDPDEALLWALDEFKDDVSGLINYLMAHRHGSPFEHGAITLFVHAPICVWREWHRHRLASYNEESARYRQLEPVFYIPDQDRPMIPCDGFKSARPNFRLPTDAEYDALVNAMTSSYEDAYETYATLLGPDQKQPQYDRGLVRDILPVGIYSSCWVTVNPRALMNFLSLRVHDPDAAKVSYPLWEIDIAARKVEAIFAELWPITYATFIKNGRVAP